jgi:hypothetical protein
MARKVVKAGRRQLFAANLCQRIILPLERGEMQANSLQLAMFFAYFGHAAAH